MRSVLQTLIPLERSGLDAGRARMFPVSIKTMAKTITKTTTKTV